VAVITVAGICSEIQMRSPWPFNYVSFYRPEKLPHRARKRGSSRSLLEFHHHAMRAFQAV